MEWMDVIFIQIKHLGTVTRVWISWWLLNEAQTLMWHRRGALLFLKVICQISRSHGTKNCRFWPQFAVCGLYLQFEFTNGFEMMHKACHSIENVPYWFLRSTIKFQCHMGQKIDDLIPIWIGLLGRSQLSNLSDLPCCLYQTQQCMFKLHYYIVSYLQNAHKRHPIAHLWGWAMGVSVVG